MRFEVSGKVARKDSMLCCLRFHSANRCWAAAIIAALLIATAEPSLLRARVDTPPPQTPQPLSPPAEEYSSATIDRMVTDVDNDASLDDDAKNRIRAILEQARQEVARLETNRTAFDEFKKRVDSASGDLADAQKRLNEIPESAPAIKLEPDAKLGDLEQELARREQVLKQLTEELNRLDNEPKRRGARLQQIPDTLTQIRDELGTVEENLSKLTSATAPADRAAHAYNTIRKSALESSIRVLETERAAYEATTELVQVERDIAARRHGHAETEVEQWRELVNSRRKTEAADAAKQAESARRAALMANPALAELADETANLASHRQELAEKIDTLSQDLEANRKVLADLMTDFDRAKEKANVAGLSHSSGQLLRKRRSSLPDSRTYRRRIRDREADERAAAFNEYDFLDQRSALANLDESAEEMAASLKGDATATAADVRPLLEIKRENLDGLRGDYRAYNDTLVELKDVERQIADLIDEYEKFIDERVLWIRSAFPFGPQDFRPAMNASQWLLSRDNWESAGRELWNDAAAYPLVAILMLVSIVVLGFVQSPIRRTIARLGDEASRRGAYRFVPTIRTLTLTLVLSICWPGLLYLIGWRFSSSLTGGELVRSLAASIRITALVWFPLELIRQICRVKGLAASHFDWSPTVLKIVRRAVRRLTFAGLPLLWIALVLNYQSLEPIWSDSLGRFCFIAFLILVSVFVWRIFRSNGGLIRQVIAQAFPRIPASVFSIGVYSITFLPTALAVLAGVGFYDTALILSLHLFQTLSLVVAMVVMHELLSRWILTRRRKLAIEQARLRRELEKAEESETEDAETTTSPVAETHEEVDLGSVSQQTVRLLRTCVLTVGAICVWMIWDDVLPALNILKGYPAWPGAQTKTLADVIGAALVLVVTIVATRNAPGLLELTLLDYLPVDTGARFATKTVFRYIIGAAGVFTAAQLVGFQWDSVQWLVAAMGIGLGFGLQEIVANFVSGIILLFERPIRVGDIVTLGDTTGTVTQIRMRATTVRDWDRREYIVPNKDLITGRLLNWTLSDELNRIVIPVGVAYGSDTDRAQQILLSVARNHPRILDDPEPSVTFQEFADSTLNFVLRCYLPDMSDRLMVTHELHSNIHRQLQRAGIDIAFPQLDIHVHSTAQPISAKEAAGR